MASKHIRDENKEGKMAKRIALLIPLGRGTKQETLRSYARLLLRNAEPVQDEDTEVVPCFLERGPTSLDEHVYHYLAYRSDRELFEAMLQIEKDAFDAITIACWHDPVLFEGRQALDIPVVGPAQVSTLFATTMGRKFGVVTLSPLVIPKQTEVVERYGLKQKLASIRALDMPLDKQLDGLTNARELIKEFQKVGRECVSDGAEVLISGCMAMAPALSLAPGCENEFPAGLREVDGAPIVDTVPLMIKAAEALTSLKKAGVPWISRKCLFSKASADIEAKWAADFPYHGSGYFPFEQ